MSPGCASASFLDVIKLSPVVFLSRVKFELYYARALRDKV